MAARSSSIATASSTKASSSLDVGTEVSFVEELGEKGPQASTVKLVGRHNHVA